MTAEGTALDPSAPAVSALDVSARGAAVGDAQAGGGRVDYETARRDRKLANVVYHDWEASTYDAKWSISFDERCVSYARDRFVAIAGTTGWPYARALELGCGTGFFSLNLALAGVVDAGAVTDISPGMVAVATRNAASLGLAVDGRVADAEAIPFDDDSFDLVVGHAVLHHIPDVELALREVLRVLRPGGRFVFAGEPTRRGDWVARRLSRLTWWAATRIAPRLPGLGSWLRAPGELTASSSEAALEALVDLHTFDPGELARTALRAGAVDVRTRTEELTASWFGWPARTIEAAVRKERLGPRWALFTYLTWRRLSALDARLLAHVVPSQLFYNVLLTGTKPRARDGRALPA